MKNKKRIGFLILSFGIAICTLTLTTTHENEIEIEPEYYNPAWDVEATEPPEPEVWFPISESERKTIEYIVSGEAKGESFKGKKLVAQCIYSAMKCDELSAEEVRIQYQYSGWDENLEFENPEAYAEVQKAVSEVFDDGLLEVNDWIFWFYAPKYCSGSWHETQRFVIEEGGHKFFGKLENNS